MLIESFDDRQNLLGHKSERITTHYSAADLANLLEAAGKACAGQTGPVLRMLKSVDGRSRKSRVVIFQVGG